MAPETVFRYYMLTAEPTTTLTRAEITVTDDDQDSSRIQMKIGLPLDGHSCIRVECPNCGLDFKVDVSSQDLQDVVSWSVGRVLQSEGVRAPQTAEPSKVAHCPYCSHEAVSQDFLHPDHWAYLKHLLVREFVEPMFANMLDSAFGGLRSNRFLKVTHTRGPRSPRPMVGPDATDMARVRCLACSGLFKVDAAWRGAVRCPQCRIDLLPT